MLVWLGPWRPWIELTLHSFARNPAFQLHIVAPEPPSTSLPANVSFHRFDAAELSRRIGRLLGVEYQLKRAYKLCDFRPAFADLFADILAPYPFWGWCDEDIIWGNLERFFTPKLLNSYDIVASTRCSISGQFIVIRRGERTHSLYRSIPRWREMLLEQQTSFAMDERPLNTAALEQEKKGHLRVLRRQFQTHDVNSVEWNAWADELERAETGCAHGEFRHGTTVWRDGRILNAATGEEFAFFHFGSWKKEWALPRIPAPSAGLGDWKVSAEGIDFPAPANADKPTQEFLARYRAECRAARLQARLGRLQQEASQFTGRLRRAVSRRLVRPKKKSVA